MGLFPTPLSDIPLILSPHTGGVAGWRGSIIYFGRGRPAGFLLCLVNKRLVLSQQKCGNLSQRHRLEGFSYAHEYLLLVKINIPFLNKIACILTKQVLEIGQGQDTDSEQIIKRGVL